MVCPEFDGASPWLMRDAGQRFSSVPFPIYAYEYLQKHIMPEATRCMVMDVGTIKLRESLYRFVVSSVLPCLPTGRVGTCSRRFFDIVLVSKV